LPGPQLAPHSPPLLQAGFHSARCCWRLMLDNRSRRADDFSLLVRGFAIRTSSGNLRRNSRARLLMLPKHCAGAFHALPAHNRGSAGIARTATSAPAAEADSKLKIHQSPGLEISDWRFQNRILPVLASRTQGRKSAAKITTQDLAAERFWPGASAIFMKFRGPKALKDRHCQANVCASRG
jgi:hypothetical protein